MKIACSACLLGRNCKYNGKNNFSRKVADLAKEHTLIPVCPEMLGGLESPRVCCEIRDGKVIGTDGNDYTEAFETGAQKAMDIILEEGAELAIVQKRSPSCGACQVYDGSFSGRLVNGQGLFAKKLKDAKIPIVEAESEK